MHRATTGRRNAGKILKVISGSVLITSAIPINPGIILGEGCIVAAGSVVTRNVKPFAIMAGSPAVMVGMRKKSKMTTAVND